MRHVLLDLDGTLVDSVYLHVVCWTDAFAAAGRPVAAARVHAGVGLGSSRLLANLLGEVPEPSLAEEVVAGHRRRFLDRAGDLRPTAGATALLEDMGGRGTPFVIATSASEEERTALLAVLGDLDVPVTDADAAPDSKPADDPLRIAAAQIGAPLDLRTTMVGDAPWDGYAATAAGVGFVAVACGGLGAEALRAAGAQRIADSPAGLLGTL
jgi:phosphoglycolate phosphatase-like HAD superfamily hydrolase